MDSVGTSGSALSCGETSMDLFALHIVDKGPVDDLNPKDSFKFFPVAIPTVHCTVMLLFKVRCFGDWVCVDHRS